MPRSAEHGKSSCDRAGTPTWRTHASVSSPRIRAQSLLVVALLAACSAPPPFAPGPSPDSSPGPERVAEPAPATSSPASSGIKQPDPAELIARHEAADHAGGANEAADDQTDPFAHPEITAEMRADLRAPRHPADGGGRAWIEGHADGSRPSVGASSRAHFPIVFEVGPRGIAADGTITLQVSPFWGWDTPQVVDPLAPGFTRVTTEAAGVELSPETLGPQLLGIRVAGRALAPGEQVHIDYGAGEARARVDRFAERGSRFWIGVDGDGDGVRKLIQNPPAVDVQAGRPALLVASLPGTARPGEEIVLHLAVLDGAGNAGTAFTGTIALALAPDSHPATLTFPPNVVLGSADQGLKSVKVRARGEGVARLVATAHPTAEAPELVAETNPLVVDPALDATLLWADLQVHSQISDGSGTPDEIFSYGRDVAGLDVVAITDHDHWGLEFLDATPGLWRETLESVARHHRDGRFVTLPGFEWTNWEQGHRHVLFFNPAEARVISSLDAATDRPDELWQALADSDAMTIAHHSAGGPVPIDWSFMPPPGIEPVTEIASVHGSSEAADTPGPIYHPKPGNTVRDALARGHRFGFVGSSDGHDGHPGLSQIAGGRSGVAGLWVMAAPARTREAVRDTLRARRTYATNGPRIFVEAALDGWPIGADLPASHDPAAPRPGPSPRPAQLEWRIAATAPIERIDVIRGNGRIGRVKGDGGRDMVGAVEVVPLAPGEWLYLRVVQSDGGAAWTSPFFAPPTATGEHRPGPGD